MSTQNPFGGEAPDALGTRVPANDTAVEIEHVDRILLDAFYEETKPLLAFAQRGFGLLALGDVAEKAAEEPGAGDASNRMPKEQ
jgi:hypothetical protein